MTGSLTPLRNADPWLVCRAVVVAVLGCLGIAGPVAYFGWGWSGLGAGAAAALCCCIGAMVGLGMAWCFRGPGHLLAQVLVGMFGRMGVALASALIVQLVGGPLAEAGFVYYVLMFYLVTLAAETVAVVRA